MIAPRGNLYTTPDAMSSDAAKLLWLRHYFVSLSLVEQEKINE